MPGRRRCGSRRDRLAAERPGDTKDWDIVLPVAARETRYQGLQLLLGRSMPSENVRLTP